MTSSGTHDTRILVVDSDTEGLGNSVSFLRDETEYTIQGVESTDEAAAAAQEGTDCVVSAYDLGETDGLSLYEKIKQETKKPHPPMVLFVEEGSEEIASQAVNSDVRGYVKKSSDDCCEKLRERVEDAVSDHIDKVRADRYETVIEALEYPVYVVDEDGEFSFVNDCFVDLTGYSRDEIIGSPTSLIKDEATVEAAKNHLGSILSSDGPDTVRFEVEIESAGGDRIPCIDHMGYLPYEGDRFRGSVGILRDVSHEKEKEQQIKVLDRVLRHNLRNKMNIVIGYAQDLEANLEGGGEEKAGRIVETVKTLLGRAEKARKIDEVLVEKETSLRRTDIAAVLEDEIQSLRDDSPGVEVVSEIPDSVTVYSIESVDAAFREILENAVEHNNSPEPRLEVDVEKGEDRAVVRVSDNGSGIPQDEIDVVTGEKEIDPVSHASGLGLWIANWVVERSDGHLEFEVTEDGSTVEVWLRKPTESSV